MAGVETTARRTAPPRTRQAAAAAAPRARPPARAAGCALTGEGENGRSCYPPTVDQTHSVTVQ